MNRNSLLLLLSLMLLSVSCREAVINSSPYGLPPDIFPDYNGVTVPATIAPMNFSMDGARLLDVTLTGDDGSTMHVRGPVAKFPARAWKKMLQANKGASIKFETYGLKDTTWYDYAPFRIYVSEDSIDYGLVYRLIAPSYEGMGKIGIYERELSSFKERELIGVDEVNGCINCHSFNQCDPSDLSLHVRGEYGATLLRKDAQLKALATKTDSTLSACVYPYWHPLGNYIAYSNNNTKQGFYQRMENILEVFDYESDIVVYDIRRNELISSPLIKGSQAWETFPAFSPDGRTLYFCSAAPKPIPEGLSDIRYNLCSIAFDPETGRFGDTVDTLVLAEPKGQSVSFPRPSFDGRFLMYTVSDFGNFSIWHNESDLKLLNLETLEINELVGVNSDFDADSYHNWSSNSRWFVFGTRRDDQTHTRPYICHIDEKGKPGRPFLLPQENPRRYYDIMLRSYNIPEFISGPVGLDHHKAWRLLKRKKREQVKYRSPDE